MIIGKCHQNILLRSVLERIEHRRGVLASAPGIGHGAAVIRLSGNGAQPGDGTSVLSENGHDPEPSALSGDGALLGDSTCVLSENGHEPEPSALSGTDVLSEVDQETGDHAGASRGRDLAVHTVTFGGRAEEIASVAIHAAAAALMIKGAAPRGFETSILMPPDCEEHELRRLVRLMDEACGAYGAEIVGGHTECTPAVREIILTVTAFGLTMDGSPHEESAKPAGREAPEGAGSAPCQWGGSSGETGLRGCVGADLSRAGRARAGDEIIMTKWAGLYGTAVIANRSFDALSRRHNPDFICETKRYMGQISVKKEIETARRMGVTAMYAVDSGGVFGALWEFAAASKVGLSVDLKKIPIRQQTVEICNDFNIHPYMLSGYGAMLLSAPNGGPVVEALGREGIRAAVIGRFNESNDRIVSVDGEYRYLEPPRGSELWKYKAALTYELE